MFFRPGRLLLIALIPALLYGAVKGILYYNAKRTVDDIVIAAANQAEVRYRDISTDLRGSVTVSGITVQPIGSSDTVGIDSVRVASDDPMFFLRMAQWQPGENAPPESLAFHVAGLEIPLSSDILAQAPGAQSAPADPSNPCVQGLRLDAPMLQRLGFGMLNMDLDGHYRLNGLARTLEFGMNMDMHEIQSVRFSTTLTDVDTETLQHGGAPELNIGRLSLAVRITPEFGRQALKACAIGTNQPVEAWSGILAEQVFAQSRDAGLTLGPGLTEAVREFYREWGEFKMVAEPAQPVGLLSLMFLPPEQLASALSLKLSLNDSPISDTSFTWDKDKVRGLSALLGTEPAPADPMAERRPRRIIVRREFEEIPVSRIAQHLHRQVLIKPRGAPARDGVLKRVADGEAEVEQNLHGGKFTVYVPLADIESLKVLMERQLPPENKVAGPSPEPAVNE